MKGEECFRCRGNHFQTQCHFKNAKCHNCGIVGHISRKCLKSNEKDVKKHLQNFIRLLEEETVVNKNEKFDDLYLIYWNANEIYRLVLTDVILNGHSIEPQLDTDSFLTVLDTKTFGIIRNGPKEMKMTDSSVKFKTYSGKTIKTLGKALIPVRYKSQIFMLLLYVIEWEKPNLLGRDWLSNLQLNWNDLFSIKEKQNQNLENLLDKLRETILNEMRTMENEKAKTEQYTKIFESSSSTLCT